VDLIDPAAGTYTVVVQGWGVVGSTPFKLYSWVLDGASAGNMAVSAPAGATLGTTGTIALTFTALTPARSTWDPLQIPALTACRPARSYK